MTGSREAAGAIKGAGGDPGDAHRGGRGARSPARCSAVVARGGRRRWQAGPTGQRRGVLRAAERASGLACAARWGRAVRRCGATWALASWPARDGACGAGPNGRRSGPGWSGPGEPSAGPRLGRAKLGCWELGRKKKGSGPRQGLGRLGLLRKRAGPMREKRATGKGWAGLGLGFGLG